MGTLKKVPIVLGNPYMYIKGKANRSAEFKLGSLLEVRLHKLLGFRVEACCKFAWENGP